MGILGIRDLSLTAKIEAAHGNPIAGIGVRCNDQPASITDLPVCCDHIRCSAHGCRAIVELVGWDVQAHQQVFDLAYGLFRWKYPQDVKAECGSKLESGQYQDLLI